MRVELATLVLLVGCQVTTPLDASPAAPRLGATSQAAPMDPGLAPSPYDQTIDVPNLAKRKSDLDLEALATKYTIYHVKVDLSSLGRLNRTGARRVELALAADPRWRVGVWDGAVVAFQRARNGHEWLVPRAGYHVDQTGVWRTGLRFTAWAPTSEWAKPQLLTYSRADQNRLALRAFQLLSGPARGLEATALTVAGPSAAVDLFEATADPTRPHTTEALSTLPLLLDKLPHEAVTDAVWDPGRNQPAHLEVRSTSRGMLDIDARIHANQPGWTWVRLLDAHGRPWEEEAVATGTRELMWGDRSDQRQSWLQSEFPVPNGRGFDAIAQLWQEPVTGGRPIRLASYPVHVPAR